MLYMFKTFVSLFPDRPRIWEWRYSSTRPLSSNYTKRNG